MTIWADYSAGRPGGAALRAAGFSGVIRYVGTPGRTKNITAAEYADLVAHGLQVLLVYENTITDTSGGYNAGVAHAQAAAIDAHNCGIPTSVGIAASSDMHMTAAQVAVGLDYVRGFRDTLGQPRTGVYGFSEFVDPVQAAGYVSWSWKCGAAPSTAERAWLTFWQRNIGTTQVSVSGIACDINDQINAPSGDDMSFDLTTPVPVPVLDDNGVYQGDQKDSNGNLVTAPFMDFARFGDAYANLAARQAIQANATMAGMAAAITALTQNGGVTKDEITAIINNAVANNTKITLTGTVTGVGGTTVPVPPAS